MLRHIRTVLLSRSIHIDLIQGFGCAFDVESGEELWHHRLPRAGIATPMTYEHDGRQYVVIAAGGHGGWGLAVGDYVVAFALPDN